ncbi:MAG: DUF3788 domain-containing protein [Bacillota bacterium]
MEWNQLFNKMTEPDHDKITQFVGKAAPLWEELRSYLESTYRVAPKMSYSNCCAQPGWNVKYQKSGKSLCTLYPMEDFFIALVVIGAKEEAETDAAMTLGVFSKPVQALYERTAFSCGGRWLMISVTDQTVLEDVKRLIAIRVKPKA